MQSFTILYPPSIASLNPSLASNFRPFCQCLRKQNPTLFSRRRMARIGLFRAELSLDAPFAAAICGCILNSFVFPIVPSLEEEEAQSSINSTDARFAAMGIISLIPYFNWMSWVFAWLDTGKIRYAVYALVYLAPYLRSNLSISPEDSWLPIVSIILGIIHIQLETSIKNGDIQGFQYLLSMQSIFHHSNCIINQNMKMMMMKKQSTRMSFFMQSGSSATVGVCYRATSN